MNGVQRFSFVRIVLEYNALALLLFKLEYNALALLLFKLEYNALALGCFFWQTTL